VPFAVLHRQFQKVLSFDPDDPFTISNECELLLRMGRFNDALRMCRRSTEIQPLSPQAASDLIKALTVELRNSEAESALQRAVGIWPDDQGLKFLHLDYEARYGDPQRASALLNDSDARPQVRDITLEIYRRLIAARISGNAADARAFTAWLERTATADQIAADFAAPMLAEMGDADGALRLAFAAPANIFAVDPIFLWQPGMLALRRDPRFVALASKSYVAAFWRQTGMWPDFCSTPGWPYDCKVDAGRLPLNAWPKAFPAQQ
jgi:tetratricopeptide (TPR) repeat protein